jgi:sterol desaturase/sphingolipid hydroxylase (fatty acid hydroxylase superfamily)
VIERVVPWRLGKADGLRLVHAGTLYMLGVLLVVVVLPASHIGAAWIAADRGIGVMYWIGTPACLAVMLGILILDLMQWVIHYALHKVPVLWRIHRLHHSDVTIDASTAFRFHPLETFLRFSVALLLILALGIPPFGVLLSYVLTLAFDVWEHANIPLPRPLRSLGRIVVTPDVHRLHHSVEPRHHDRNMGTIFTFWDRLAGTWCGEVPDTRARFGIADRPKGEDRLGEMLTDPWR